MKTKNLHFGRSRYSIDINEELNNKFLLKLIDNGEYTSDLDYNKITATLHREDLIELKNIIEEILNETVVSNGVMKYTVQNFLPKCPNIEDRFIGSNWCTQECDFCESSENEYDDHGRLDITTITCSYNKLKNISSGDTVVATYGFNDLLMKPFEFLYDFGYYTEYGCVVYNQGERNIQDSHVFKLSKIRPANKDDLKKLSWGI